MSNMVMEFISGLIKIGTKVNSKMENRMARVY